MQEKYFIAAVLTILYTKTPQTSTLGSVFGRNSWQKSNGKYLDLNQESRLNEHTCYRLHGSTYKPITIIHF